MRIITGQIAVLIILGTAQFADGQPQPSGVFLLPGYQYENELAVDTVSQRVFKPDGLEIRLGMGMVGDPFDEEADLNTIRWQKKIVTDDWIVVCTMTKSDYLCVVYISKAIDDGVKVLSALIRSPGDMADLLMMGLTSPPERPPSTTQPSAAPALSVRRLAGYEFRPDGQITAIPSIRVFKAGGMEMEVREGMVEDRFKNFDDSKVHWRKELQTRDQIVVTALWKSDDLTVTYYSKADRTPVKEFSAAIRSPTDLADLLMMALLSPAPQR